VVPTTTVRWHSVRLTRHTPQARLHLEQLALAPWRTDMLSTCRLPAI
jgi:hypothetical protein